jgi:hypothetical protein
VDRYFMIFLTVSELTAGIRGPDTIGGSR